MNVTVHFTPSPVTPSPVTPSPAFRYIYVGDHGVYSMPTDRQNFPSCVVRKDMFTVKVL